MKFTTARRSMLVLFPVLSVVAVTSSAFADTSPTYTVNNTSTSVSRGQGVVTDSAHLDMSVSSNTVFYEKANGMPRAQQLNAINHHHVVTLSKRMTLWTSYIDKYGNEVWHWKTYAKGHKFYRGPDGFFHDTPCDNKVIVPHIGKKLPTGAHKLFGSIVIKRTHTYVAAATAKVTFVVQVVATASCGDAQNGASASAYGYGYAYAYATATATGTSAASVNAAAVAKADQLKLSVNFSDQQTADANAAAVADAEVKATAEAHCTTPSVTQSISITSMTDLNQIPAGMNSGPYSIQVYASAAGGSVTVDPGIGAVSDCNGGSPQGSMTFTNLPSGNTSLCVVIWAPNDADQPASFTVTTTANLGTATDTKTDQVAITYPVRP